MPGLAEYLLTSPPLSDALTSTPECIPLYLPSALPENRRQNCIGGIDLIEERLCFAQAYEALIQLRLQLMKRTVAIRYKSRTAESQRSHTRFRTLQDQTNNKIKSVQMKYTIARTAILSLRGPGAWEQSLKVLLPEDIRGLGEHGLRAEERDVDHQMQELGGLDSTVCWSLTKICEMISMPLPSTQFIPGLARGEGRRTLSWIWYSTTGEEINEGETESCRWSNPHSVADSLLIDHNG